MTVVRRATGSDAEAIATVHIGTWQVAYRGQLPDAYLDGLSADLPRRIEVWRRRIGDPPREVWVAEDDGRAVGFVALGPSGDDDRTADTGEVYAIYLDPAEWGRGIGRALFEKANERLAALGYREATLWVLDSNTRARRFYEAGGWRVDGAVKTEPRGDFELREVRYRTSLPT